jgi:transaldolase/glucose-6-phosphate isomerase
MSTVNDVNPKLKALTEAGVSVWLDQLGRSLLESGELQRMVEQDSLRGVTSNPAIFEKAILGSEDYEAEISRLAKAGADAKEIYDTLVVADVQGACDVLATVHEQTGGVDGFVSLEVQPDLARDATRTLDSARRYWGLVNRPNLMIKIPGTSEGVDAIEQAIYEGINVNVTLLFAVEHYDAIAHAYIRGLERRHAEGKSLDVHSVASFFVSRVDSLVDKQLVASDGEAARLAGTAALANARAAYERFTEIFSGPRWDALAAAGAVVQRPLWASTGVKNPDYPDTLYVDQLIAADTVNTMPMATLRAAAEHGKVVHDTARIDARADLQRLADVGIDMDAVTDRLLTDGIQLFVDAMDELLAGIESRREVAAGDGGVAAAAEIDASLPGELERAVAARVQRADEEHVASRIWKHDPSLWGGPGIPEIEDRLGWLTVTDELRAHAAELDELAQTLRDEGYTDAVLLGMGGSSLGPEVIRASYGPQAGGLTLHVLDSTHPDAVKGLADTLDIAKTVFIVSSKSGGTIETLSHYRYFKSLAKPEQFVVVTDEGSPLAALAEGDGLRKTFLNPTDIGGRYSVLSYFGLVPAALAGVSVRELLKSASLGERACAAGRDGDENIGLWFGAAIGELALAGRDKLTFIVSEPIDSFGLWVEQLIAESTGKQGRGVLPVADEPLASPDAYGNDRVFIYLRDRQHPSAQLDAAVAKLRAASQPTITLPTSGAGDLGRLFFVAEFAVAVAGWALAINPFDQPNVQEAKDNTGKVLAAGTVPAVQPADDAALKALLSDAQPPHYVAILGYLPTFGPRNTGIDAAVSELRATIRRLTGAATTFGYGPRFQHSTGQEHKGGAPIGRFLQLVDEPASKVAIPGQPYDFGYLIAAQAAGEIQTLHAHGLPAERVLLQGDLAQAIRDFTTRLQEVPR